MGEKDVKTIAGTFGNSIALLAASLASHVALADVGPAKTVASGLWNPRGLNFAPNGDLYVAEAGQGGPGPCVPSPVFPFPPRCYGETGAVTLILPNEASPAGSFRRVVTGLPSLVLGTGTVEGGPSDVAFLGTAPYVTLGLGGNPTTVRPAVGGKAAMLGTLLHATPSGQYKVVADIAGAEAAANPDGAAVDSNPYSVLVQPGRRIVADAGANALFVAHANGRSAVFAEDLLGPNPVQTVPTSVVEGPDGAIYVGLLTGFPFVPGSARVLRVASDGSSISTYASGFTAIIDLAFDAGGALYVLQVIPGGGPPAPGGKLVRQCPGGAQSELLTGLTFPGGVAIGPDGAAYVTNRGTTPNGEVLRLPLTPCP
jgi:hypothetical protein